MPDENPLTIDWTQYAQARRNGAPIPQRVLRYFDGFAARLLSIKERKISRLDRAAVYVLGVPSSRGRRIALREDNGEVWESNRIAGFIFIALSGGKTLNQSYLWVAQQLSLSKAVVQRAWVQNGRDWENPSIITSVRSTNRRTGVSTTWVPTTIDVNVKTPIAENRAAARVERRSVLRRSRCSNIT
jgi:hypothetical protein